MSVNRKLRQILANLVLLLVCLGQVGYAQTGRIKGAVVSHDPGCPQGPREGCPESNVHIRPFAVGSQRRCESSISREGGEFTLIGQPALSELQITAFLKKRDGTRYYGEAYVQTVVENQVMPADPKPIVLRKNEKPASPPSTDTARRDESDVVMHLVRISLTGNRLQSSESATKQSATKEDSLSGITTVRLNLP